MNSPLVSVVIPTHNRPGLLPRAVKSALDHLGDTVEVLVVPNGGDDTWRRSLKPLSRDERVRIEPVATGNVSVARNHGLRSARGKYVRFLDDDDYLLPGALEQLELMEASRAEICSGHVGSVDQHGHEHGQVSFPDTEDFVCAAVLFSGFRLPVGHLFLRSALADCRWDEEIERAEDYAWQLDLAAQRDWKWVALDRVVGIWFQHDQTRRGLRASVLATMKGRQEAIISRLLSLHRRLEQSGRGSLQRDSAIAAALWHYAHRGFPYRPFYWVRIARKAVNISVSSRPDSYAYQEGLLRRTPPVLAECVFVPVRRLTRLYRDLRLALDDIEYVRKL